MKWETVELGSCVHEMRGGASVTDDDLTESGFPVVHKGAIREGGKLVFDRDGKSHVSEEYAKAKPASVVTSDFVIATLRNLVKTGETLGFVAPAPMGTEFLLAQGAYGLRLKDEKLDKRYLAHLSNAWIFHKEILKRMVGSTQVHIRNSQFLQVPIPLPPLTEQKRIAGILDATDALRAKRREALTQLDTLLQATFLDLFGEKAETVSIGDMLERDILLLHKDGNHGSLYPRAEEFGPVGIPFLSAKCISENGDLLRDEVQFLSESKARKLKLGWIESGDVLLAHNASVGKTFGYRGEFEEALIGTSLTAFRANRKVLDPAYLLGALRSQDFQQRLFSNMGQTTRNQVPITAQRRLTLPLPPLDRQKRFASIVNSIEEQRKVAGRHLAELDTFFASLQSRAFKREL